MTNNKIKINFFSLYITVLICLFVSSCTKPNAGIFLSGEPQTSYFSNDLRDLSTEDLKRIQKNIEAQNFIPTFFAGQQIYYLLLSKKPIRSEVLRLQTIKLDKKYNYAIEQMEIPYAIDILRGENQHAVSDYIVLRQSGRYFIRIFSMDNLKRPIAQAEFFLENP